MKTVVVDGRMVGPIPHGVSRYVTRMAQGLREVRENIENPYELIFLIGRDCPAEAFAGFKIARAGSPFLNPLEFLEIPMMLRRLKADLYHSPTFGSLLFSPCPTIVTIHDLNHLAYGGRKEKLYYERILKPFARKSRKILTVSEFSRKELAPWLDLPEGEIGVVMNAIDPASIEPFSDEENAPVLQKHSLTSRGYLFCLSNPKPHKNVAFLVEAYREYRRTVSNPLPLVLSVTGFEAEEGVLGLGALDDLEARVLLGAAAAVLFPSLYEGFGLPPVEAAALGSPVVVSRIPPHEEGLVDLEPEAVLWADPRNPQTWIQALQKVTQNGLRGASVDTRFRILDRFSPVRMGRDMDRIYRSVLGLKAI